MKAVLRTRLKAARSRLSAAQVREASLAMAARAFREVDWQDVSTLHVYTPLMRQREADPGPLLDKVIRQHPGIRIARLDHIEAFWENGDAVSPEHQFEVVIVPMLGFTERCYRLGFGGGFYDRFLSGQVRALKIGLAYDLSYCEFEPEPHDVPMDMVVTESRVFRRG